VIGWRGILSLVLFAAVLVSGWAVWTQRAPEPPSGPASARSDYQLYDFDLIVLEKDGSEAFTLRAPHMARQPGDQSMSLETPLFLFPAGDDAQDRWEVRALEGWVSPDGDRITLTREVRAQGPGSGGNRARLETESLDVFPRTDEASTDQRVTIVDGRSTIRGLGLRVNLATKRYVLLSEVESRYAPSR
jgi:lipopolysaccharide export system protein LptC